jgi:hypothetical protein
MSVNGMAWLYEDPDSRGRIATRAIGASQRYELIPTRDLISSDMYHRISSVGVASGSGFHTSLICFGVPFPYRFGFNYDGQFVQLTSEGPETKTNFDRLDFDNVTHGALLVKEAVAEESRFSFRDLFLGEWDSFLNTSLGGAAIRDPDQQTILTWEMFPEGVTGLDPLLRYLKIYQPLQINPPCWAYSYKASFTYWVLLSLDSGGILQGFVARSAIWVADGTIHDEILAKLVPPIATDGPSKLNIELAEALKPFRRGKFTDLYYLPGKQITLPSPGVRSGWTTDDVTIVLQH